MRKAIDFCIQLKTLKNLGELHCNKGRAFHLLDNYLEAVPEFEKACEVFLLQKNYSIYNSCIRMLRETYGVVIE